MGAVLVQHVTGNADLITITLPSPPTAGNWLILALATSGAPVAAPVGWTLLDDYNKGSFKSSNRRKTLWARVVPAGLSAIVAPYPNPPNLTTHALTSYDLSEWSGVLAPSVTAAALGTGGAPSVAIAPTALSLVVGFLWSLDSNTPTDGPIAPGAGMTTLAQQAISTVGAMLVEYRTAPGAVTVAGVTTLGFNVSTATDHQWQAAAAGFPIMVGASIPRGYW